MILDGTVLDSVVALGGLTAGLVTLIVLAEKWLWVEEDPRVDTVEAMLPHVNCGACGFPGCRPFAEALVAGKAVPASCTVSDDAGRERIAAYLGSAVGSVVRQVARLACAGGANVARLRAHAVGLDSCAAAASVGGGPKGCSWGCIGLGDCAVSCHFDAIHMSPTGLPVVDESRCTACGDCVDACPKLLFSLRPIVARLWVACRAPVVGDAILAECEVACTACGRCARDAPNLIVMRGGLPVVDETRPADDTAIFNCPTGAIVWLDPVAGAIRGPAAHPILREGPRPVAPS